MLKYVIASVIGAVAAFAIAYYRSGTAPAGNTLSFISDGLFVVGFFYTAFGLLLVIASEGVLDIIGFGFKSLIYLFTPYRRNREEGGFYEYKVRRKEARKPIPFYILWTGIAFILLSVFFLILYY